MTRAEALVVGSTDARGLRWKRIRRTTTYRNTRHYADPGTHGTRRSIVPITETGHTPRITIGHRVSRNPSRFRSKVEPAGLEYRRRPRRIEGSKDRSAPDRLEVRAPSRAGAARRTPGPPAIAIPPKEHAMHLRTPPQSRLGLLALLLALPGLDAGSRPATQRERGSAGQPAGQRDQPLPAAARPQPGGLVSLGPRGVRQGQGREQADLPLGRLQLVLLVPRHGARELRRSRDRQGISTRTSSASRSIARSGPTSTRSTWRPSRPSAAAAGRCRCS